MGLTSAAERRTTLSEPIRVRGILGSVVFDLPDQPQWPRFSFTYEDVRVESNSSIQLDLRQRIYETKLLWTTPYLDAQSRYRVTLEPIYQFWRVTTDAVDVFPREDKHRGILNAVIHDDHGQREFFFQVLYGRGDHEDARVEETERSFRAEWRQWYQPGRTAFSTLGVVYSDSVFDSATDLPDDHVRDFEVFANLLMEIDPQGRWRWFNQAAFNRRDVDIFLNEVEGSTNRVFDFIRIESRITHEFIPDVDLSIGLEHTVADTHAFDSLGWVARASIFEFGPFRAEFGVRDTWYYNLDEDLLTAFMEINFAR